MNIFESLRADHDIQRELLEKLVQTEGHTSEREELFGELKKELEIHANAEERHFYVPLIEEDMTQEHARHGVAEHHEIDELIEQCEETEMSSPAWLTHAKKLQEKVLHHLEDEEQTIFQLAGKVLSESAKIDLSKEYQQAVQSHRN